MRILGKIVLSAVILILVPTFCRGEGIWGRVQPAPGESVLPKEVTVTLELPMESYEETVTVNPEGKFFFSVWAGTFVAARLTVRSPGYQARMIQLSTDDRIPPVLILSLGPRLAHAPAANPSSLVVDAAALATVPEMAVKEFRKAEEESNQGKLESALQHLGKALKKAPDFAVALALQGIVLTRLHRLDEAEVSFRKALEFSPHDSGANKNFGYLLLTTGRETEAVTLLQTAVEDSPADVSALAFLGEALFQSGRTQESLTPLEKAHELAPDFFRVSYRLGFVYLKLGREKDALQAFQQFLKTNRGMDDSQVKELVDKLEKAVRVSP